MKIDHLLYEGKQNRIPEDHLKVLCSTQTTDNQIAEKIASLLESGHSKATTAEELSEILCNQEEEQD